MLGRHRYGTALELSLVILTSCCVLPGWWTHMPNSGLGIWQHRQRNVASVYWGHPLVLMRTSAHICNTIDSHQVLFARIPAVPDLQSEWVLLLYCASTRANSFLRVCLPDSAESFVVQHDNNVWHCLCQLIWHLPHRPTWERGSLPLHMGGVGLRSASRSSQCCVLGQLGRLLGNHSHVQTPWLLLCQTHQLQPLILLELPTAVICSLMLDLRVLTGLPCCSDSALQISTSVTPALQVMGGSSLPLSRWRFVSRRFVVWPRLSPTEQALMRSQSGPMAGLPFSCIPSSNLFVFTPEVFRVLLLRRFWLPLPPASRNCRCGRPLDVLGHHRAACSRAGVLASRGSSLEFAAAQVCREAGGRVSMNVFVRDLDLPVARIDSRRLEVVVDGLLLFGGAQLAVDTTLVSPVSADGQPRRRCAAHDGAALEQARQAKVSTYPELSGAYGRARLVVLAAETDGRWSLEAVNFVSQLAKAKARSVPRVLCNIVRHAYHHRWCSMLACAASRAFALSLLERRAAGGSDGDLPSLHDVVAACRHLPLTSM